MTLELVCRGHLAPICDWCYTCKKDIRNNECFLYTPTTIEIINVEPDYIASPDALYVVEVEDLDNVILKVEKDLWKSCGRIGLEEESNG